MLLTIEVNWSFFPTELPEEGIISRDKFFAKTILIIFAKEFVLTSRYQFSG